MSQPVWVLVLTLSPCQLRDRQYEDTGVYGLPTYRFRAHRILVYENVTSDLSIRTNYSHQTEYSDQSQSNQLFTPIH